MVLNYRTEDNTETIYTQLRKKNNKNTAKQNTLVQSLLMSLGQETRWAYSTMLLRPHGTGSTRVQQRIRSTKNKLQDPKDIIYSHFSFYLLYYNQKTSVSKHKLPKSLSSIFQMTHSYRLNIIFSCPQTNI